MTTRIFIKKVVIYTLAVLLSAGACIATAAVASADNHWDGSATFEGSVDDRAPIDSKTISQESGENVTIKLTNLSDNDGELDSVTIKVHDTALTINNTDDEGKTYDVAGETVEFVSWDTTDGGNQYVVTFGLLYDAAPVCGPVSLSNNDSLNAYAYCNDGGGDDCKESDRQSTTTTREFSGGSPLPASTTVDVAIDLSVEAVNYDSRANARTTISLLDYSGDTIDEKEKSISVDNPPEDDVTNRDSLQTTVSFPDSGGATEISVDQSVFAGAGPGGGGSGHDSTNASADASAVDVTVTSPSCNNPTADDDGTTNAGICADKDKDSLKIDVLDNDGDENGNDYDKSNIIITQITEEPSASGSDAVQIIDDNGVDKLSYTPDSNTTGEVTFGYEAEFPDGITDTATVTVDVGSCGEIRVSFNATNDEANPGGTADPTYTHDSIDDLVPQTAASSGDELTWRVPLEVATNTAELIDDYIEPPEGYQLAEGPSGELNIRKYTELFDQFGRSSETDQTGTDTSAWLGEDYEAETPDACSDGDDNDGDGTTDSADCNCANGNTDSESSGGNCQDPQADFTTQSEGPQNQCLRLDGSGSTDEGEIVDYSWKLESSNSQRDGSGEVISDHSFSEASSWDVTLTVTDNDGGTTSTTTINAHQVEATPDNTDCNWGGDGGGGSDDGGGGQDDGDDGEDNPPETR